MTTIEGSPFLRRGTTPGSDRSRASSHRVDLLEHVLLTTREAAALTRYTPHSLENLHSAGRSTAFIKIKGGAVAYRLCDLLAWQDKHRVGTLDQV